MLNNHEKIRMIKEFYENMSDEEFKQRLINAGVEVDDSIPGQIIFIDEENEVNE